MRSVGEREKYSLAAGARRDTVIGVLCEWAFRGHCERNRTINSVKSGGGSDGDRGGERFVAGSIGVPLLGS
jgi:hypothetical protein